ncbi:MAG: SDR family NAD(P)-dependent oxidoreductase, partial [Saprospiraceae bacterium]|nr:SDR family NAD(P)-dependent oxidoreductase [Saprospiraceae bacterium]
LYERLGLVQDAIPYFKKSLSFEPDHEFANYDLALIYFDLGEKTIAKEFYIRAFQNNPELRTIVNDTAFHFSKSDLDDPGRIIDPSEDDLNPESIDMTKPQASTVKTVLITGATAGIGLATAKAFLQEGYKVIITGRREDRLRSFSESLDQKTSKSLQTLAFDVRDHKACEKALLDLPKDFQQIDVLINNAGLASGRDSIQEGDVEDWNRMIDTNIKGLLHMTRLVSPQMVKRGTGHIINVCSIAGHQPYPKGNVYVATKYAVDGLTQSMRLDLYEHGIRVSQISPGAVEETEFARVRFHGDTEMAKIYEDYNPLKSTDVAEAILFIATRPPYVNIQDIIIMGTQQAGSTFFDRSGRKYD